MTLAPPAPPLTLRGGTTARLRARVDVLGGRRAVVVDDRPEHLGPTLLGAADGDVLTAAADLARGQRLPLVVVLGAEGTAVGDGIEALAAWGRAARSVVACSGSVPVLAGVTGPAVAGPSLLLGVADVVVMAAGARTYVSGPHAVRAMTGTAISAERLGGAQVHATRTGLAAVVAEDGPDTWAALADVLAWLPDSADELAPTRRTDDPVDRPTPELRDVLPTRPSGAYDVRDVVRSIVDDGELLELRPHWAANIVTGFAAVGGAPVGVVANQPGRLAGTLDITASQKGARFVALCDAFNLPLVTLVDTPGFAPGRDQEWRGMIRKGAQLAFAYARATVPRVCVTLRKSYGGAHIVMDSKTMGNDLALAWPTAQIAVMGAKGAVEVLHRRADEDERRRLEADYEDRLLNPYVAAERGLVDAVIDPADTRRHVAAGLAVLATKRESLPRRAHDNAPL